MRASESAGSCVDGLAILGDGRILAAGGTNDPLEIDFTVIRLTPAGVLDPTFGTGGRVSTLLAGENALPNDLALQQDGRIVVTGASADGLANPFFTTIRITSAGAPDTTWGSFGVVKTPLVFFDIATSIAVQSDGKVLVFGTVNGAQGGRLVRYEGDVGTPPDCGNGILDPGEECDDGNAASGDCCSSICTLDPVGTVCGPTFQCSGSVCDGAGACGEDDLPDGTACESGSACTVDFCQAGGCQSTPGPSLGCKRQRPRRGTLLIRDDANDARDQIRWNWLKGDSTTPAEFAQQDYELCVFDSSANPQPVTNLATNGNLCDPFRCWKLVGLSHHIYIDPFANHDGLRQIFLKPGSNEKANVKLFARGEGVPLPPLPLTPPVRVQLHGQSGDCCESIYEEPKRNSTTVFRASPD